MLRLTRISTREAGPCLGDSGGPQLAGDTALSITSGGSKDCSGAAEGYRLDTAQAKAFLSGLRPAPVRSAAEAASARTALAAPPRSTRA